MSFKRIGILLGKEFLHGSRGYIFIFSIVAPVILSLVVSLIFGSLAGSRPTLGVLDEGGSRLVPMIRELDTLDLREYDSLSEIKNDVERGALDVGITLPAGFDASISTGADVEMSAFVWGESLAKDRSIIAVTITNQIRELTGQESPVNIETITLGEEASVPWNDRLLPFLVLRRLRS